MKQKRIEKVRRMSNDMAGTVDERRWRRGIVGELGGVFKMVGRFESGGDDGLWPGFLSSRSVGWARDHDDDDLAMLEDRFGER